MEKIVEKGLKIDLHIHSFCSKHRESDDTVLNCKYADIDSLANILHKNELDIVSISDHDVFSYKYYEKLKSFEGKYFKKVFPAVEFSVALKNENNDDWPVHIIAVFNDEDPEGVKRIEKVLGSADNEKEPSKNKKPNYDAINNKYFSETKFVELLHEINLDVVFIAHQKQTLTSKQDPKNNDINGVGEIKFNEFLFSEYFQALEFRDKKNELFNIKSQRKLKKELLRFITGSDCHEWSCYPKHDSNSSGDFKFTYLKCLPCFRGLALALTDETRISLVDSFFSASEEYLKTIELNINGIPRSIPLSKGINAIIGDNSIGKSLLLHKITDYYRVVFETETSAIDSKLKDNYEKYLKDNNIEIINRLLSDKIYGFDSQGEIRKKFALNKIKETDFISKRAPENESITTNKNSVVKTIDEYIKYLKSIEGIKNKADVLEKSKIVFSDKILEPVVLKIEECSYGSISDSITNLEKDSSNLQNAIEALNNVLKYFTEKNLEQIKETIKLLKEKRDGILLSKNIQTAKIDIMSLINDVLKEFDKNQTKTADDKEIEKFNNSKNNLIDAIINSCENSEELVLKNPEIEEAAVEIVPLPYGDYKIVTKCDQLLVNNDYLLELVKSPLKSGFFVVNSFYSEADLATAISRRDTKLQPWDEYLTRIRDKVNIDFTEKIRILKKDEPNNAEHSSGLNEQMYFKVISEDRKNPGVYIIDQPEDDISQIAIRDDLLNDLKRMSEIRQIILITHNPQFVVNLDVDNVIYLHKDNEGKIAIDSGALEYNDDNEDILKDVAEALDGGVYTIRKRWKRYEKNIDDII